MDSSKRTLIAVNLVGGFLVVGSYVWGFLLHPLEARYLWGGISQKVVPLYITSMVLATAGYLLFTGYFLFVFDPQKEKIHTQAGYKGLILLYWLILLPSALWMPLTIWMLISPGNLVWFAIRMALMLVGLGALGIASVLWGIQPKSRWVWSSLLGCVFFCIQTVLLDALIWPNYFHLP